jgi:hypothetical protein
VGTGDGVSEGCIVAVKVGVPFGNRVEVCVLVGDAVSVAVTVALSTGIGVITGVQASIMNTRITTTSTIRFIITLSSFFHRGAVGIGAARSSKSQYDTRTSSIQASISLGVACYRLVFFAIISPYESNEHTRTLTA